MPLPDSTDARRARLAELLLERSIREGSFTLASGGTSRFFCDVKPTVMHPEGAALVGALMLDELARLDPVPVSIGGLETGAIPVVQCVVCAAFDTGRPLDGFFVRKQPKATGTRARLEGVIEPDTHVVLVEDVTTQGGSALKAVDAVRELGCTVNALLTVVDRQRGAAENLAKHGIRLVPLLDAEQLGMRED